ncbi:ABC transporter [Mycolicibacterium boenickei]
MLRTLTMVLVGILIAGCSADPEAPPMEGPRESKRPVTHLVLVEKQTGAGAVLDGAESVETALGEFGHVDAVSGDGRYAYLHGDSGLTILDGGAWTFDHGDHAHYYEASPAVVGRIEGRVATVHGQGALTVARRADGAVEPLDRDAFARHEVSPLPGPSEKAVAAVAFGRDVITVTDRGLVQHGDRAAVLGHCPAVTDAAVLRRKVVFGCGDGALQISRRDGKLVAESIPFEAARPRVPLAPFGYRRQGNSLAAAAGDEVWLLNGRRWTSMLLSGVIAVNTAGGDTVLALTQDGVLHALDLAAGVRTGRVELLGAPVGTPAIEVGAGRAYVNDAAARAVHEIDYSNGLRVVRTHPTNVTPDFMVAAGW